MKNSSKSEAGQIPKKVVLLGGFGWNDIGDEAMPWNVMMNLRSGMNGIDFVMISPNPEYTETYHGVRAVPEIDLDSCPRVLYRAFGERGLYVFNLLKFTLIMLWLLFLRAGARSGLFKDVKTIWDEMTSANVLFNCGGGNLNSLMRSEMLKKLAVHWIAHLQKVPVLISGQTIGPLHYRLDRILLKHTLNRAKMITLRDKGISAGRLRNIGVGRPIIEDTADDAMSLPSISQEKALKLIEGEAPEGWVNLDRRIFSVNLRGGFWLSSTESVSTRQVMSLFAEYIDVLVGSMRGKVMLISTDYCPGSDDRLALREVYLEVKNKDKVVFFEREYRHEELKGMLALSDVCIGSRYHFEVFGLSAGVPCVGIAAGDYQKTKLKGIHDLCGLSRYCFEADIDNIAIDDLIATTQNLLKEASEIRNKLNRQVPELIERSLNTIRYARELMC